MSGRRAAGIRIRGAVAAVLAVVVVCAGAAVAVARLGAATVTTHQGWLGKMLAASNGHTLYLFRHDKRNKSTCYHACISTWRPLLTRGRPVAAQGSGVNPTLLGTARRKSGTVQVTYAGHPLYTYAGDKKAGQMKGENRYQFGGRWYAVRTSGNAIKPPSSGGGGCASCY